MRAMGGGEGESITGVGGGGHKWYHRRGRGRGVGAANQTVGVGIGFCLKTGQHSFFFFCNYKENKKNNTRMLDTLFIKDFIDIMEQCF